MIARWAVLPVLVFASPAMARDYCSTRPSLGQSACVLDPGRVAVETALTDWERDRQDGDRTDRVLIADTLLRIGLSDRAEAQVGFSPIGVERSRQEGARTRVGDLSVGTRINLRNPDGKGLSFGVQPTLTVPVGRQPIGDGTWSALLVAPVTYDAAETVNLQFSPQVGGEANEDGDGRHLTYGGTVGVELALSDALSLTPELQWLHEDAPADRHDETVVALSLAWRVNADLFLDAGSTIGLDHDAPDHRVFAGISRRF